MPSQNEVADTIRRQVQAFAQAFNSGSGAAVANCYTEDGMALPPGSPSVQGRQAISQVWQSVIDAGVKSMKLEPLEITPGDNLTAYEVARFGVTTPGGAMQGKYIVIWKQVSGKWQVHRDIWNMDSA